MVAGKRKASVVFSISELKALTLLAANSNGLFGSQLVHLSSGFLGRGTIYTTLNRLVGKGLIQASVASATSELNLDRPLYQITTRGIMAIEEFVKDFGFVWVVKK